MRVIAFSADDLSVNRVAIWSQLGLIILLLVYAELVKQLV